MAEESGQSGLASIAGAFGGPAGLVTAGLGLVQSVGALIGQSKARKEMAKLQAQRKAYQTPEEVYKILEATQSNASQGLGAQTLQYLTGVADNAFSSSIGAAALNGANPNDMGALFEQRVQQSMAVGAQNTAAQMANFSKYLGALNTVSDNKTAEWQSRENILKDRIQAASAKSGDATKSLESGANSILSALAAGQEMGLYDSRETLSSANWRTPVGSGYSTSAGGTTTTPRSTPNTTITTRVP